MGRGVFFVEGCIFRKMRPAVIYGVFQSFRGVAGKISIIRNLRGKEPGRIFCGGVYFSEKYAPQLSMGFYRIFVKLLVKYKFFGICEGRSRGVFFVDSALILF